MGATAAGRAVWNIGGTRKTMSKPYVSFLIDTNNREQFIEQGIISVLKQDMSTLDVETLVVDDDSTDRANAGEDPFYC